MVAFSAPFQDEQAKARFVLIDGLKFEVKAPEPGAADGRPGSRRGAGPRPDSSARPGAQRQTPTPDRESPGRRQNRSERSLARSEKGKPRPPKETQELAQAKPKAAPPARSKVQEHSAARGSQAQDGFATRQTKSRRPSRLRATAVTRCQAGQAPRKRRRPSRWLTWPPSSMPTAYPESRPAAAF